MRNSEEKLPESELRKRLLRGAISRDELRTILEEDKKIALTAQWLMHKRNILDRARVALLEAWERGGSFEDAKHPQVSRESGYDWDEELFFALRSLGSNNSWVRFWAKEYLDSLIDLNPEVHSRYLEAFERRIRSRVRPLCSKCLYRTEKRTVKYASRRSISFFACRKCGSPKDFIEDVETVALVLDCQSEESMFPTGTSMSVSWFAYKEPFDFDEIRIIHCDELDVEELVMKVRNDMDKERRKRYKSVSVYISANLRLSQAKGNMLRETFDTLNEIEQR